VFGQGRDKATVSGHFLKRMQSDSPAHYWPVLPGFRFPLVTALLGSGSDFVRITPEWADDAPQMSEQIILLSEICSTQ
jgi:hypothetical protein